TLTEDLQTTGTLAAGASIERTATFQLPFGYAGSVGIVIEGDNFDRRFEFNPAGTGESNNDAALTLDQPLADAPDLTATIETPPTTTSGEQIEVRFTVTNDGAAATDGSWVDRFFLVPEDGGPETLLGELARPVDLAPGESYSRVTVFTLPIEASGAFRLRVEANANEGEFEFAGGNNVGLSDVFAVTLAPSPDLRVVDIAVPGGVRAGALLSISFDVRNDGTAPTDAAGWIDRIFISQNPDGLDGSAIQLGQTANPTFLLPGESYNTEFSAPIAANLSGSWFVYVVTDAGNAQFELFAEANNTTRSALAVPIDPIPQPAFFTVTDVTVTPTDPLAGQAVLVTWTVTNTGGEPIVGNWSDALIVSPTATFDDQLSRILQIVPVGDAAPLDPGASYTRQAFLNLPGDLAGPQFVLVDPDHLVTASGTGGIGAGDVDKVLGSTPIDVLEAPLAVLQVSNVDAPDTAEAGVPVSVSWTVLNDGIAPTSVGSWDDTVYLSPTPTFTLDGPDAAQFLGRLRRTGGLDPAQSYDATGTFTVPIGLEGTFFVFVVSDLENRVPTSAPRPIVAGDPGPIEVAPFDNTGTGGGDVDPTAQISDLRITTINGPSTADSGTDVTVSWVVTNTGPFSTVASAWSDRLFLSPTPDTGGPGVVTLRGVGRSGALGVDGSYTRSVTVTLPESIAGDFFLVVQTDFGSSVLEGPAGELNNTAATPLLVTERDLPALAVETLDAPPTIVAGQTNTISWTVRNDGTGPTLPRETNWTDAVYLTDNGVVDNNAILLGTRRRNGGLAPGASYAASIDATVALGVEG
ncbi:MAG: hypothetical protein AAF743_10625, partial [Planctomycetota bacterium]